MAKPIKIEILGDASGFKKALGVADKGLGKLGKAAGIAGLGIAGGLAVGAAAVFKFGQEFEAMQVTLVKGTGATGQALDELFESTKNVLRGVPESGAIVSSVLADVNTFFGATGDELEVLTEGILDFARVAGVDANTAVGNLDAAFTQFGVPLEAADEAMGDFLRISQATGAPMDQLLGQMETFGPLFANAGFSLEATTALFGNLEQAGVSVTRVGPGLNRFFREAAEAGEDSQQAFFDVVSSMSSAATGAEALNIATEAFGAEGAQRMVTAVRSGSLSLESMAELMGTGTGLVEEQAEATETFSDKWMEFKNNVLVALEPLISRLFDTLSVGMDHLQSFIETLRTGLVEDEGTGLERFALAVRRDVIPIIEQAIGLFKEWAPIVLDLAVDGFAALAEVAGVVWDVLSKIIDYLADNEEVLAAIAIVIGGALVAAFLAWAGAAAAAALATLIAMAPIILIGAAIAALIALVIWLYRENETFRKVVDAVGRWLRDVFWPILKSIGAWIRDTLIPTFFDVTAAIAEWLVTAALVVADIAVEFAKIVAKVAGVAADIASKGWEIYLAIIRPFRDAIAWILEKFEDVTRLPVPGWLEWVMGADDAPGKGISSPRSIPKTGGGHPLGRNAMGTSSFGGGFTSINERAGSEAVFLPQGSRITPAHMNRGGGGDTFNFNQTMSTPEVAREIAWRKRMGDGR